MSTPSTVDLDLIEYQEFFSELYSLRADRKYTDVTIKCDNRNFRCHRVILAATSKYFDSLFGGNSQESKKETFTIPSSGITAATFSEVLEFAYARNIMVTHENVFKLLQANKLFQVTGIVNRCIQFVEQNTMTVQNTYDIFEFACKTKNKVLMNVLSQDMEEKFAIFSRAPRFLEMSPSHITTLLDRFSHLPSRSSNNDESLLGGIVRWIIHSPRQRLQYFDRLYKSVRFETLSPMYMKLIFPELMKLARESSGDTTTRALSEMIKPIASSDVPILSRNACFLNNETENCLHVYTRFKGKNSINILSITPDRQCTLTPTTISIPGTFNWIRTVALNDHQLYCLKYIRRNFKINDGTYQSFHLCTGIDMCSPVSLKPPPVILDDISWCPIQNNMYLYNQTLSTRRSSKMNPPNLHHFTDEEIKRGIYVYNCELDIWLPVPAMNREVEVDACLAVLDNRLFFIGAGSSTTANDNQQFSYAFDYRSGTWQKFASSRSYHLQADCCTFDGKIYICGGKDYSFSLERYDPVIGKWEDLAELTTATALDHRLVPFLNKIWLLETFNTEENLSDLVQIYDPYFDDWSYSPILGTAVGQTADVNSALGTLLDCVIFPHVVESG